MTLYVLETSVTVDEPGGLPAWLVMLFSLAMGLAALGSAIAVVKRWSKPVTQTLRLIVGEELPNGKRAPGMLDDVAELKAAVLEMKTDIADAVRELRPDHGSSLKDVVNAIRLEQEAAAAQREEYHRQGVARDTEQNARLEALERETVDANHRDTTAIQEIRVQLGVLTGQMMGTTGSPGLGGMANA